MRNMTLGNKDKGCSVVQIAGPPQAHQLRAGPWDERCFLEQSLFLLAHVRNLNIFLNSKKLNRTFKR
jgi:hypothetical protein